MNTQRTTDIIFPLIFSPNNAWWYLLIEIIFILVSLALVILIIYLLLKTTWLDNLYFTNWKNFIGHKTADERKFLHQWESIEKRLGSKKESEYKLAIIEADSILDDLFQKLGYKGETMDEKLRHITPDVIDDLDMIIYAHDIRNNIAHDPDYQLSLDQTKKTLDIYKKAFQDLELL